jgi:hypothetical protein
MNGAMGELVICPGHLPGHPVRRWMPLVAAIHRPSAGRRSEAAAWGLYSHKFS